MPFTPIAHAIGQSPNLVDPAVTGTMNATGATLLIAFVSQVNTGTAIGTISDSASTANVWTKLTTVADDLQGAIYYSLNPTVTANMTVTATKVSGSPGLGVSVSAWSGNKLSGVFDQQNGTTNANTATIQPGSITPGEDNELVITGFTGVSEAATINSGFTITDSVPVAGGAAFSNGMAYKIQTSAAAVNPTWSVVTAQAAAAVIASFRGEAGGATDFTATARQTTVNKNQNGYVDIAPFPDGSGFDAPTTIIGNCTNGTSNFIRQSDGVQTTGSVTLTGTDTAVMQVFSTQSSASIVYSWTTNNAAITSPAATSFTVQAVESSFVAVTPSILWNATSPGSGFTSIPIEASTVSHGTGFSQVTIVAAGDRVYGEYITDSRRTVCIPSVQGDPSGESRHRIYFENQTPVDAYNGRLLSDGCLVYGHGFEFPDVDGAYIWYDVVEPFNGKESVLGVVMFYDHGGTLPKITSTITDVAGFYAAFSTDPVNKVSLNTIAAATNIIMNSSTIAGSWTSSMPLVIKGTSRTTSIVSGMTGGAEFAFTTLINVPSIQFENLTYNATNIGRFKASNPAVSLIFKDCNIIESLGEFSKYLSQVSQFEAGNGVFFINCTGRLSSCSGMAGVRSTGDGAINRIPDFVVGFDFFQNPSVGHVFSTYAKRFSTEPNIPVSALTTVTVASSAFNVGTNSNLTQITVSDMPQYSGTEYLTYIESIQLSSVNYAAVIGRTDVANGIIYVAGDLTGSLVDGVTTINLSAILQQRLHFADTLVITGATNNHDGTATLTWANSGQTESVGATEQMQFATTTTTTALKGLRFEKNDITPGSRTILVNGELAGSAVAGDLIWLMQIAHADANQIGLGGSQSANVGPIMEMNYLNEGFQSWLFQPGSTFSVANFGAVNVVSNGFQGQFQQRSINVVMKNLTNPTTLLQNTFIEGPDFFINESIIYSTDANNPGTWNNDMAFSNSHGIGQVLPNGIGNTTGGISLDLFYNSTTSALQSRVWNTDVAFDLYGNAATTNGSTYSRIGAVLGDPTSDEPIIPGTLILLSQTLTQAVFQFGSANGLAVTMTFQSSTSNGVAWADLISLPNQDFSGIQYATDAPPLGQTWIFREEFINVTDTEYSNTLTLNGLAPLLAGTISHVTSGLLLGMV